MNAYRNIMLAFRDMSFEKYEQCNKDLDLIENELSILALVGI